MPHRLARAASVAFVFAVASRVPAESPVIVPCESLPAALAALGPAAELESFGAAAAADVAVATRASPGDPGRSVLRFVRGGEAPRTIQLAGRVVGLAVADDGRLAYAVVRATDRKGTVRSVELVRVDLGSARATSGTTLPATARGLAFGLRGATLMVASRDEIRTFQLPHLASGALYRLIGDNVGVAPIPGSSQILVAQPMRIALADLAGAQGRDGLAVLQEHAAPAPLHGMMASVGNLGPIALSGDGLTWCVRVGSVAVEPAPLPPAPVAAAPMETAPVAPVPTEPAPQPPVIPEPRELPAGPGTVFGVVAGPARGDVAAIVVLGPDNVLREAARSVPDDQGRFIAAGLPAGAYRIVAAGFEGRVLICDPPFITIRLGSDGAVAAPVLKVLRAQ